MCNGTLVEKFCQPNSFLWDKDVPSGCLPHTQDSGLDSQATKNKTKWKALSPLVPYPLVSPKLWQFLIFIFTTFIVLTLLDCHLKLSSSLLYCYEDTPWPRHLLQNEHLTRGLLPVSEHQPCSLPNPSKQFVNWILSMQIWVFGGHSYSNHRRNTEYIPISSDIFHLIIFF